MLPNQQPLHHDLAALQLAYNQIVTALNAGQLTVDEAMEHLALQVAADGSGNEWGLTPAGEWQARTPGGQWAGPVDPAQFVTEQLTADAFPPPPDFDWETSSGNVVERDFVSHHDTGSAADGTVEPSPSLKERAAGFVSLIAVLADRYRKFVIAGVAVLLVVVAAVVASGGGPDPVSTDGSIPLASPSAEPAPAELTALPVDADVKRVQAALSSGNLEQVKSVVVSGSARADLVIVAATFQGLAAQGAKVAAGASASSGKRKAAQMWTVSLAGRTVTKEKVSWVVDDGVWKLSKLPTL